MAVTFDQSSESIQQKHIPTVDYPSGVLCQEPQTAEATDLPNLVTISSPHSLQEEVALEGGQIGHLIHPSFPLIPEIRWGRDDGGHRPRSSSWLAANSL